MSFVVFADGTANLPQNLLNGILLLPCEYTLNGEPRVYDGNVDEFDGHAYYELLRNGANIKTSLLNSQLFLSRFTPILEQGKDIIYVAMSSGISGTCQAARSAAKELMERFKDRFVYIVDSYGCGFGSGMLAIQAAKWSHEKMDARSAAKRLDEEVPQACQYFTVDDLNFLKRTGRISGSTAKIGTLLHIKPILFGDKTGHITVCEKVRGRKKAIEVLARRFEEKRLKTAAPRVFISHGDCPEDAEYLAEQIKGKAADASVLICQHEPFSGSHVGPGMLGLFFWGVER